MCTLDLALLSTILTVLVAHINVRILEYRNHAFWILRCLGPSKNVRRILRVLYVVRGPPMDTPVESYGIGLSPPPGCSICLWARALTKSFRVALGGARASGKK